MEAISVNEVIGRNVRRLRGDRGWTQRELADRLSDWIGERWDVSTVSRAEADPKHGKPARRAYTADEIVALALIFGVSLIELFTPANGDRVRIGNQDTSTAELAGGETFLRSVVYFPHLADRLNQAVLEGRFSGWATVDRLKEAGFEDWQAEVLAAADWLWTGRPPHQEDTDDGDRTYAEPPDEKGAN